MKRPTVGAFECRKMNLTLASVPAATAAKVSNGQNGFKCTRSTGLQREEKLALNGSRSARPVYTFLYPKGTRETTVIRRQRRNSMTHNCELRTLLRRTFARASAIAMLCLTLASARSAQIQVLVADKSAGTVKALGPSLTTIGTVTLPAPADPLGIAVNPAGTLAAVTNFNNNRVDFLDLTVSPPVVTGFSVNTVLSAMPFVALFPEDLVFSPDGACLLVSDGRPGYVASINVTARTLVTSLTGVQSQAVEFVPSNPNNMVLTADQVGNKIHVLHLGAGCVLTDTGVTVATPGDAPKNITALPDGQRALVAHRDGTVGVLSISGATVSFISSFVIGTLDSLSPFPSEVQSFVVFGGSRAYAYQANKGNVEVLNIDASDNVSDSGVGIPVSSNSAVLGVELIATDGNSVFVSTGTGASSINVALNQVSNTVASGAVPRGIAVAGSFQQIVTSLITELSSPALSLTSGQIASLTDKLNNVLASIQQGLNKQAINELNAIINSINAGLKTGHISGSGAATLIAAANAIIALLS